MNHESSSYGRWFWNTDTTADKFNSKTNASNPEPSYDGIHDDESQEARNY